jgi:hypothetical protein
VKSSLVFVAFKASAITLVLGMMTMATILKFIIPRLVAVVAIPGVMTTAVMGVMVVMLRALIMLMAAQDTPLVDVTQLIGATMLALIPTGVCLIRIFNVMHANVLAMLRRWDMLAQALFLTKYMKQLLDDRTRGKLEMSWLNHWHTQLSKPSRTPCMVMRAYLNEMGMTFEDLDVQMCWDCWPSDDNPFKDLELPNPE